MQLIPNYSYEYNCILNSQLNQKEQIQNFSSLITDKDRFLSLLQHLKNNKETIEKALGFKLKQNYNFYIVRAEKFKSFSEPITIEYSIIPEEMLLYLLKEIIKTSFQIRFPDEITREQYINSFIEHIVKKDKIKNLNLEKFTQNLHNSSKQEFKDYQIKNIDFSKKTIKEHLEELFLDF